jgi:transposase
VASVSTRVDVRERRSFSVDEKRRIVGEYRAAVALGDGSGGLVLRREGIYQSLVFKWGLQIDDGTLGSRRRGPAPTGRDLSKTRIRELEAQLARARGKIDTLEDLVTAQGKCLALHVEVRTDDSAIFPTVS